MSVTAIQPVLLATVPLRLHENVLSAAQAPPEPTQVKRFPQAFRPGAPGRASRCRRPLQTLLDPPNSFLSQQELEQDFQAEFGHDFDEVFYPDVSNAEAQAVAEKLFPPSDRTLAAAESVAAVAHAAAPAVLEVLAGARPARQLCHSLSPECMLKLKYQMRLGADQRPDPDEYCYSNPRVMRMRITQVLPLIFEAAVILRDMQKVRATALRIERWHGRWQVTALEIG